MQLETERQQEAEKAAKVHDEMREAHSRLKAIEKELKQLTTNQVSHLVYAGLHATADAYADHQLQSNA